MVMEESLVGGKGNTTGIALVEKTSVEMHLLPFSFGFDPIQE